MARGKLKYKDVVGKRNGQPRNTKQKNKPKPRKKYSLYNNEKKNTHKQKFNEKISRPSIAPKKTERKRQKFENPPAKEIPSDSESEVEDYMVKLRKALGCDSNNKKAIESESETEEEDMDVENTEEEKNKDDMSASENEEMGNKTDEDEPEFGIETQNEEDDTDNSKDPFVRHVFYELHESLLDSVQNYSKSVNSFTKVWPKLGTIYIQIPKCDEISAQVNNEISLSEKKVYAPPGELPKEINIRTVKPEDLFIKTQICKNLFKANKNNVPNQDELFTPLQGEIFSIINNYQDLYYPERTFKNGEEIRYTYCLHAVNHILKTRLKVIHHNARLSKKDEVPEEFRDQGLVRPKVLIIVPFKDAAYRIIKLMIDLILPEDKGNVMNKKRFVDDYTGNELIFPKKNPKPEDYEQIFQGNSSDDFKIGITVTKKSLKLYANFYSSDIIIASPLGLRRIIGAEGEQERDYDFLASIELLIMDQTEIFLMQNWDHVFHILNHMHLQPKEFHGTDLFRVRTWSLNGWAKYYRQTLIFSSLNLPEINAIFNKKSLNYAGKVKVMNPIEFGSISQVVVQIPHVFQRFEAQSHVDAIDARFDFFVNKVLPKHRDNMMRQTLIYIPSYFDYVRVRNYFKREDIGFVQICEYSEKRKVARARDIFFHGDAHFLLYTERYHFFNRNRIKGIRHIIFYQPPVFPHFFSEMCNLMQEYNMNKKVGSMLYMTVTVIYSKYDALQLSSIVGTERAAKICQSDRKVHVMVTERD